MTLKITVKLPELASSLKVDLSELRIWYSRNVNTTQIQLSDLKPFSKGGNRLCFVSPKDSNVCLKVHQADRSPELRRQRKSFPANLRPVAFFDENQQEYASLKRHFDAFPAAICRHLPKTYGMVDTDLGTAHAMELIRDEDGLISLTLELYVWNNGIDERIAKALENFKTDWMTAPPRSRDILPHNLVVRQTAETANIIIIDGYGRKPKSSLLGVASKQKTQDRFDKLDQRLNEVIRRKSENDPKARLESLNRHL
ncbi:MAG: YrbL family protein [Opitutaceae bacterium]